AAERRGVRPDRPSALPMLQTADRARLVASRARLLRGVPIRAVRIHPRGLCIGVLRHDGRDRPRPLLLSRSERAGARVAAHRVRGETTWRFEYKWMI